jgi:hypothetical protein
MTDDRLDTKIRGLMIEIVDSTPTAPTWESIAADLAHGASTSTAEGADAPRTAAGRTGVATIPGVDPDTSPNPVVRPGARTADPTDGDVRGLPAYTPRPDDPHRNRWRPLVIILGFLGALGGGTFAYTSLTQDDGAASPEAAVERFVDALTGADVIGALESLPPSERTPVVDLARDAARESERIGLTRDLELGDVSGFELTVTELSLRPEPLGEGVVAVHLDGTLTARGIGADLPLGDAVLDAIGGATGLGDFAASVADLEGMWADEDVFVVALHEGDGWHVSAWYTVAEYLRRAEGAPLPAFGAGPVAPVGATSPEAAVREMMESFSAGDIEGFVSMLEPREARVLYDYLPVFDLGGIDESTRSDLETNEFHHVIELITEITDLTVDVTGSGSQRVAAVVGYEMVQTSSDDSMGSTVVSFDGDCVRSQQEFRFDDQSEPERHDSTSCRADALAQGYTPAQWDLMVRQEYLVVELDGRWFVRPAASVAHALIAGLDALSSAEQVVEDGGAFRLFSQFWSVVPTPGGGMLVQTGRASTAEAFAAMGTMVGPDGEALQYRGRDIVHWGYDQDGDGNLACWIALMPDGAAIDVDCDDPEVATLLLGMAPTDTEVLPPDGSPAPGSGIEIEPPMEDPTGP